MILRRNEPLSSHTTLGLGGPARTFLEPESEGELIEALRDARAHATPLLLLGGGSNLVVSDAGFEGTVLKFGRSTGETKITRDSTDDAYVVDAGAGRSWDDFVAEMVTIGASGVESLSGIPGLVGATPMQNVGAYGQEVSQRLESVRVFDRHEGVTKTLPSEACAFGYRESLFRGSDRYAILSVRFRLPHRGESGPIRYRELAQALGIVGDRGAPLARVRETVMSLRRGKGMVVDPDDTESRSAGSFFKNPVLDAAALSALSARVSERLPGQTVPTYPDTAAAPSDRRKVSAAWLIERAGLRKGEGGKIRLSKKHALSIVNAGGGTASELAAFARGIQAAVFDAFQVRLEAEPIFVGLSL